MSDENLREFPKHQSVPLHFARYRQLEFIVFAMKSPFNTANNIFKKIKKTQIHSNSLFQSESPSSKYYGQDPLHTEYPIDPLFPLALITHSAGK